MYVLFAYCKSASVSKKIIDVTKCKDTFSKCEVVIGTLFDIVNFFRQDPRPFGKLVKPYNVVFHLNIRNF